VAQRFQRCGKGIILNPALAAEVAFNARERVFPQPLEALPLQTLNADARLFP
jgi:hypothetical protein